LRCKAPHHHLTIQRDCWHCRAIGGEIGRDVCDGVLARQRLAGEQQTLPAKRSQPTELEEEPKLGSIGDLFATREERCGDRRSTSRHQLSASDERLDGASLDRDLKPLSGRPALEGFRPDANFAKERCFGLYSP
jgi:hypothetical protein